MKYWIKDQSGEIIAKFDDYEYAFVFMKAYFDYFSVESGRALMIVVAEQDDFCQEVDENDIEKVTKSKSKSSKNSKKSK